MKNSLYIGRVAGIRILIHWTFPLIIFWIILTNLRQGFTLEQLTWLVSFVLVLFLCVTLHELGHALAAKHFNIITKDITLLPIGGVARMENMPGKPKQELIVAIAGPIVNVLIFLILYAALFLSNQPLLLTDYAFIDKGNFIANLALLNIWLALFNLIPAFPMDGGRVLRALLGFRLTRVKSTEIAARTGQALAILFIIAGIFFNPFLIFIGLFIFISAAAESTQVKNEALLSGHVIGELTMKQLPALNRKDTIEKAVSLLLDGQAKNFLVMDNGEPYGTLNREGIIKALSGKGKDSLVEFSTDTNICYIEAAEPVDKALQLMQLHKYPLLIVTKNKLFYGVVDIENILEYIMIANASANQSELHKVN